jgi:sulfur-carrier protein adenylyltransferase/sulfurtransferase
MNTRFARQIRLEQIGNLGQAKIEAASVLVIGVGGLGCAALQYLAAAGVGTLGMVDFDRIDLSNLHRQLLYHTADIGKSKVEIATLAVQKIAPDANVKSYFEFLDNKKALEIFIDYDIILDCTDQIHTRYLINDACKLLNKPWIYGSISGFEGQWALFHCHVDYRDVFPKSQNPLTAVTCELAGTLGVISGTIGTLQALEAIK